MNCAECKELLAAFIEGLLDEPQERSILSHLNCCQTCRAEADQLTNIHDRLVANGKNLAKNQLEDKVLNQILQEQSSQLRKANRQFKLWRAIVKSRITKLAAAAIIVVAAALTITFLQQSTTPAYAIEQTIEANHTVRYLHIKDFKNGEDEPKEFWLEFNDYGEVENVRAYLPAWNYPPDGAKVIVWKQNKAYVWLKDKNIFITVWDKKVAYDVLKMAQESDPKLAVENLHQLASQGKVKIDISEPADKAEPITVTATYLPESKKPNNREVLFIDRATKLVTDIESYQWKNDEYQYIGVMEFFDYNQHIDPEMFILNDEVPANAMRIDQTTQEVGLPQSELTDEEIAVEVVRQFFEALIDNDYAKAGKLLEGIPADRLKQGFANTKFLRIVSIGKPYPHPDPETKGLVVPCTVELEKDGQITEWKLERLGVRPVYGQPGRWTIFGGI